MAERPNVRAFLVPALPSAMIFMEIVIRPDAAAAAGLTVAFIAQVLRINPRPVFGLATGRTVEPVSARLVEMHRREWLDFSRCRTFNLDEYIGLPSGNSNSYRAFMNHHLFAKVNLKPQYTHLPDGMAADPEAECARYERLITQFGGVGLQLLGLGRNGHIGFNEPPCTMSSRTPVQQLSPAKLGKSAPLFPFPERVPDHAITMGIGTILDSPRCLLLATGEEKAEIVARTVAGPLTSAVPASALQTHCDCVIVLDEAAASRLKKNIGSDNLWL